MKAEPYPEFPMHLAVRMPIVIGVLDEGSDCRGGNTSIDRASWRVRGP